MSSSQWAIDIKQTIIQAAPKVDAASIDPAWAQFWASLVGLVIAIGVPLALNLMDRAERAKEKKAKANTHAIGVLTDLVMLSAAVSTARNACGKSIVEVLRWGKIITNLSPQLKAILPYLHEFGDASQSMQQAFACIKRMEQIVFIAENEEKDGGVMKDSTRQGLFKILELCDDHLKLAGDAVDKMLKGEARKRSWRPPKAKA